MSHRRRRRIVALTIAAAIGVAIGGVATATAGDDRMTPDPGVAAHAGFLTPSSGIAVANLTVRPGRYFVRSTFEARLDTPFGFGAAAPTALRCGLIDNNGVERFLTEDLAPVRSGRGWEQHTISTQVSLPDVTLGVRCFPTEAGLGRAAFRAVSLSVTDLPR